MFASSLLPAAAWQGYKCISRRGVEVYICPRCRDAVKVKKEYRDAGMIINYRFCVEHQNKYVNHEN
jgi:hypothetical protein